MLVKEEHLYEMRMLSISLASFGQRERYIVTEVTWKISKSEGID